MKKSRFTEEQMVRILRAADEHGATEAGVSQMARIFERAGMHGRSFTVEQDAIERYATSVPSPRTRGAEPG